MRIDTDIVVTDEYGRDAEVSCSSAEQLAHIMQAENIEECNVTTNFMGQEVNTQLMSLKEVEEWARMNKNIDEMEL